ncbi:wax ester/triacylglycerol synthase family O-acyltransferase [Nocardioides sp. ChNu-153]|uniref:wax ester/triacylglycerol synthase family O-acyltransferase n=1 Tax=Nocardioides sp. ChNu-153 TaxID=2779364 RepID=UPI002653D32B|nr:wax ester/triacylglycerol synthase family O-acyltransferase [Nocardioides sp. ChNu-153]MDN7122700.1 wax ester/triacylglycerol synthase family O-acyltransferase [Nocardioides sp. ChNu-153]
MGERLRSRDMAILATDSTTSPLHNATLEIFDPGESGFDHERLVALIGDRITFVPRYRQRLLTVPGHLATPVWSDDLRFDLAYHVRRSAIPRPGTLEQLLELVARIVSRPLDRTRPLWEVYFIEGLEDGRVAVLSKSHQILVDGMETVDLGQVLLDVSATPKVMEPDEWEPARRPTNPGLVADALRDTLTEPSALLANGRVLGQSVARRTLGVRRRLTSLAGPLAPLGGPLAAQPPVSESPITPAALSQQRRVAGVRTSLADHRRVREVHGGTVNDVVLATVAGGLRNWLMARDQRIGPQSKVRALVPMSVIDDELEATSLGTQIQGHLVDLPVGEASPVVRLHQVSYSFKAHGETGRAVAANRLAGIAGFAPTTFHALGTRVALGELGSRRFQLTVTNVPGPQFPLYAAGARMVATYPVPPLLPRHALGIGVTSYDGHVYYGVTGDRDVIDDLDIFAQCLRDALDELVDTASDTRPRAPRGRSRPRPATGPTDPAPGPAADPAPGPGATS